MLSGSQRQKVAIARAYVRNSEFVMMDELNAALDPIAECELRERFKKLYDNRIMIVISYRLSNSSLMDKIIVFSDGTIIESGTHDCLMKKQGSLRSRGAASCLRSNCVLSLRKIPRSP